MWVDVLGLVPSKLVVFCWRVVFVAVVGFFGKLMVVSIKVFFCEGLSVVSAILVLFVV